MGNPWRGEVTLVIDGQPHVMRLTLGALAELETELRTGSLVELVERFEGGACSVGDVIAVLRAGLRGANAAPMPDLAVAQIEGGPIAGAKAAAQLLVRAFSMPDAPE